MATNTPLQLTCLLVVFRLFVLQGSVPVLMSYRLTEVSGAGIDVVPAV